MAQCMTALYIFVDIQDAMAWMRSVAAGAGRLCEQRAATGRALDGAPACNFHFPGSPPPNPDPVKAPS